MSETSGVSYLVLFDIPYNFRIIYALILLYLLFVHTTLCLEFFVPGSYKRHNGRIDYLDGGGIISHLRDHSEAGFRQLIEHRCFTAGDEYIVTGSFKLQNATGHGASCDPHEDQGWRKKTNCPSIHLKAWGCSTSNGAWDKLMRTDSFKFNGWNPDDFNDFSYELTVDADLASCTNAEIYVYDIDPELSIVAKSVSFDVKTPVPTQEPTLPRTPAPTSTPTDPIVVPTAAPTSQPTMNETALPGPGFSSYIGDGTAPIALAKAESGVITTLSEVTVDANGTESFVIPIARSYNGNGWEKEPGRIVEDTMYDVDWNCYFGACEIDLPDLGPNKQYKLSSNEAPLRYTDPSLNSNDNVVARFLEQATFGATQADIDSINSATSTRRRLAVEDNINSWIIDQMDETVTPPTSHREYWRARANSRVRKHCLLGPFCTRLATNCFLFIIFIVDHLTYITIPFLPYFSLFPLLSKVACSRGSRSRRQPL